MLQTVQVTRISRSLPECRPSLCEQHPLALGAPRKWVRKERISSCILLHIHRASRRQYIATLRWFAAESRIHGQRTVTALRKALRFHAEGMVKPCSVVFPGKGCRQLD
jgi:hypothetical protein